MTLQAALDSLFILCRDCAVRAKPIRLTLDAAELAFGQPLAPSTMRYAKADGSTVTSPQNLAPKGGTADLIT